MKKYLLSILFLSFVHTLLVGQNETDAIRYANLKPIGTARYSAMGGAFGALGGDLTSIAYNPAGIGVYRRSDFSLSTAWTGNGTEANYNQEFLKAGRYNFTLSNIGFVSAFPSIESSDWKYVNFGFAYNQLANFNRDVNIRGRNLESSKLDPETQYLNNNPNDYEQNPYYNADVVFYDEDNKRYYNDYNFQGNYYGADLENLIRTRGYAGEYDFALGANYRDFLFVGATLGILHVDYSETKTYSENPLNDSIGLKSFESVEHFNTKGNGVNFKAGFILKLGHLIRIGGAFQTPTMFNLKDNYYTDVYGVIDIDGEKSTKGQSPRTNYNWEYNTPLKLTASAAIVLGRFAVVSADMEFMDYSSMSLSADDYSFIDENDQISSNYRWAANVKAGAEFRIGLLSLRGGLAFYQSPYKTEFKNSDAHTYQLSAGIGIKTKGVYFDATYMYRLQNEQYYMWDGPDTDVTLKHRTGNFIATMGYRF